VIIDNCTVKFQWQRKETHPEYMLTETLDHPVCCRHSVESYINDNECTNFLNNKTILVTNCSTKVTFQVVSASKMMWCMLEYVERGQKIK